MSPAEVTLRELLRTIAEKHYHQQYKLEIKSFHSGGANYTSALFLATLSAKDKEDLHLFAKVAIVGDRMRELMNATKMFAIEGFFYNELVQKYKNIQDKYGVAEDDRCEIPKFYGCNSKYGEETIVLEDLGARGYYGYNRLNSLDWEHASSAIEELAKFHSLSFAYENEEPDDFDRVMKYLWFTKPNHDDTINSTYFPKLISQALQNISNENHRERVKKFMGAGGDEMFETFNRPFGHPVLIHGDYRTSNLLFKKDVSLLF